jgi:outer membrane protein assembly factor BamB
VALDLKTGEDLWTTQAGTIAPRTLVMVDEVIVMQDGRSVVAYDARKGEMLWDKTVPPIAGGEGEDLFVVEGWCGGILCVNGDASRE